MSAAVAEFANPQVNEQIYGEISRLVTNNSKIKRK